MKFSYITFFLTLYSLTGNATQSNQEKNILFINRVHDFGNIREDDGIRTCVFEFTNPNETPVYVSEVRSSCGCTMPEFEKKEIGKGEKGFIRVGYDPVNRPGAFERMLIVAYRDRVKTDTLFIKGQVAKSELQRCPGFRYRFGDLCIKKESLILKGFDPTKQRQETILLHNPSDEEIVLRFIGLSGQFELTTEPARIKPGEEADLIVTYRPDQYDKSQRSFVYEVWQMNENSERHLFDLNIETGQPAMPGASVSPGSTNRY